MKHEYNAIGLNNALTEQLSVKLNVLLSHYQLFYINTRGLHWNIKGEKFFELHLKFEELYNDLQLKIDEIAERILTLGYTPLHSYTGYLSVSGIAEQTNISDGNAGIKSILAALSSILPLQRDILALSAEGNDEGTNALMSDYIRQQEKLVWMYSAYLNV
ncbi:MAG: DNA starvation/stationary phase protection protein [Ignavibacteria bacterium]|nr:DNA starvation/stationary phase protection protein [Ignavibacteria bacterium]